MQAPDFGLSLAKLSVLPGVRPGFLDPSIQTVGLDIQPFCHVSHGMTAIGHLLNGFDFELVGIATGYQDFLDGATAALPPRMQYSARGHAVSNNASGGAQPTKGASQSWKLDRYGRVMDIPCCLHKALGRPMQHVTGT